MFSLVARYARWLHTGHPAGAVEPFPEIREDGSTAVDGLVDGLWVAGDLTGVPLLKHAVDSGARVVDRIAGRGGDLVIVGAGVAGMSAALQARRLGLDFRVVETREPFATIADFPKAKPIFTYPAEMEPAGTLRITANVKESLLDELRQQASPIETVSGTARQVVRESAGLRVELEDGSSLSARNVLVAIGRSGEYRALGVEGENGEQVHRRLHDPHAFTGSDVVVIGGGDTAVESAVALADAGAHVTLAHRGNQLKRPKPENLRRLQQGPVRVLPGAQTRSIGSDQVEFDIQGERHSVPASTTFVLIGRTPPLDFFRRSGVPIRGEWNVKRWLSLVVLLAIAFFVYHWKSDSGPGIYSRFSERGWFPFGIADPASPATLGGTLRISMQTPAFWYSLAYSLAVTVFGVLRIRRRNTPYITRQTLTLMVIQVVPLFLLPFVILPWLGHNGFFDTGWRLWLADELFPATEWDPQGREYWRSVGFILAWPLMIWNVFSDQPLKLWLAFSLVQTFVLIPLMVRRWGKGAYCGWICSCGALADACRFLVLAGCELVEAGLHGGTHGTRRRLVRPGRDRELSELRLVGRPSPRGDSRRRALRPLQWPHLVPLRMPAGRTDELVRKARYAVQDLRRCKALHQLQPLHDKLSPGNRRHALCAAGGADGRSPVRHSNSVGSIRRLDPKSRGTAGVPRRPLRTLDRNPE
jgi:thioredoxin reductase